MPAKKIYFTDEQRDEARKRNYKRYSESEKGIKRNTEWYRKNKNRPEIRERYKKYTRDWYERLPEEKKKEYNRKRLSYRKSLNKRSPEQSMLASARKRAKEKGLQFNLKIEDIVVPKYCPVLGIPLFVKGGQKSDNSPSLDRFDNDKGYTKDNIRVISLRANVLKNNANVEEIRKILAYMEGRCLGTE